MAVNYTSTIALFPTETISESFETDQVDMKDYLGYSISFVVTNASVDLDMEVSIKVSACDNGNYAEVTGSKLHLAGDDVVVFNVSHVYYKNFKVPVTITTGSCDLLIEVTRK